MGQKTEKVTVLTLPYSASENRCFRVTSVKDATYITQRIISRGLYPSSSLRSLQQQPCRAAAVDGGRLPSAKCQCSLALSALLSRRGESADSLPERLSRRTAFYSQPFPFLLRPSQPPQPSQARTALDGVGLASACPRLSLALVFPHPTGCEQRWPRKNCRPR